MDLFGKKRIRQLEEALADKDRLLTIQQTGWRECEEKLKAAKNQIEYLVRTIRQTDDIIFSISQCTNWESMRPRVAQLTDQMTARKVAESNRIGDILRQELIDTYKSEPNPKRLTHG